MPAHGDNILIIGVEFSEPVTKTPHQRVDGLLADAFLCRFRPDGVDNIVPRADTAPRLVQQLKQTVLVQGELRLKLLPLIITCRVCGSSVSPERRGSTSSSVNGTVASAPMNLSFTASATWISSPSCNSCCPTTRSPLR